MFFTLPQSQPTVSTAPSRREPYEKLNGGDRKASLSEGGGKPNGLDGGSECLTVVSAVDFYVRRTPSVSKADSSLPEGALRRAQ